MFTVIWVVERQIIFLHRLCVCVCLCMYGGVYLCASPHSRTYTYINVGRASNTSENIYDTIETFSLFLEIIFLYSISPEITCHFPTFTFCVYPHIIKFCNKKLLRHLFVQIRHANEVLQNLFSRMEKFEGFGR